MLYGLYEAQHAALEPLRQAAEAARSWFGHPFSPLAYTPLSRRLVAATDLFLRLARRYERPAWGIDTVSVDGAAVPVSIEQELERPFCRLVRFRRDRGSEQGVRVLVVAPLSGHHATLVRDTVRTLLAHHEVWVTDWVDARMVPLAAGPFHLDDYVDCVRAFLRHLARAGRPTAVVSVCQPTVPVLAAVSLMAEDGEAATPRAMVMMGGPIDARKSPTAVNNLARRHSYAWFERTLITRVPAKYPGFMRRVYPGFLQYLGFVAMNPDRHLLAHWDYYHHLVRGDGESAQAHRRFYDEYNAVLDMPAEYYLDTIRIVFQEFALPRGRWRVRGRPVRPQAIRQTALLTVEGELDDISGNGQTEAAHVLCVNVPADRRAHLRAAGVGHYGIFSGRRWRETIYPRVREFLARHAAT